MTMEVIQVVLSAQAVDSNMQKKPCQEQNLPAFLLSLSGQLNC